MRYILTLLIFINGLFAHGLNVEHIHIFNHFHLADYILMLIGAVGTVAISKKLFKGSD